MRTRTTLSLSEARKKIFTIAEEVQESGVFYTLTEYGRPKVVVAAAEAFESLLDQVAFARSRRTRHNQVETRESGVSYEAASDAWVSLVREVPTVPYADGRLADPHSQAKDLVRAQLYVELVEKCGYSLETVRVGKYVRVGEADSRKYIEADILVEDKRKGSVIVCMVVAPDVYERRSATAMRELFEIAAALHSHGRKLKDIKLIYYTRLQKGAERARQRCMVVDYGQYQTFENWEKQGMKKETALPKYVPVG